MQTSTILRPTYCVPTYCVPTYCVPTYCVPTSCVPTYCVPTYCVPTYCVPIYCVPERVGNITNLILATSTSTSKESFGSKYNVCFIFRKLSPQIIQFLFSDHYTEYNKRERTLCCVYI
jgi:hypothetical protein